KRRHRGAHREAPMRDPAGRPPPADIEAEAVLLASILSRPERLDMVLDTLGQEDFYDGRHRAIFRALCALREAGEPRELAPLRAQLDASGDVARAGGSSYLAELGGCVPVSVHVERHANRVAQLADMRRLIETAHRIVAEGYGEVADPREWIQN